MIRQFKRCNPSFSNLVTELSDFPNDDSVWNFHVWNEVWLNGSGHWPADYAGWAACDATPQEESCDLSQCGPAPVKAIKNGEVFIGFDAGFIFSEVNADKITWIVKKV